MIAVGIHLASGRLTSPCLSRKIGNTVADSWQEFSADKAEKVGNNGKKLPPLNIKILKKKHLKIRI
jgi:hypothetical protein